jgi:hypothetical protein
MSKLSEDCEGNVSRKKALVSWAWKGTTVLIKEWF